MIIALLVLVLFVINGVLIWEAIKDAPIGYEDENGFHFGERTFKSKEEAEKALINEFNFRKVV